MTMIFKLFAILVHMFQGSVSYSADLYFSSIIAALLVGIYVIDLRTFKKAFLLPQWAISCVGSIVWLVVAMIEVPIDQ